MSENEHASTAIVAPRCKDEGHEFACRFAYGSCVRCMPDDRYSCWTCGTPMPASVYAVAPREPEPNEDKRTCEACYYAIVFLPNALQVMNMARYAAGLPTVECLSCDGPSCRRCGGSDSGS